MTDDSPLTVARAADGTLVGAPRPGRSGQVFGGQISAQCLAAARHAAGDDHDLAHSVHVTYLSPGDTGRPIAHDTVLLKAGRAFAVVRVDARQGERLLATATVSFHRSEPGGEHGVRPGPVPSPADCPVLVHDEIGGGSPVWAEVEARRVDVVPDLDAPRMRLWMRWAERLDDDATRHAGAVAWMTDLLVVRTSRLAAPVGADGRAGASLDHSLWFHRRLRADDWLLFDAQGLVRSGARALGEVRVFDAGGALVATSAQECLVR